MAIFLAALSALSYGCSDFIGGIGGRRGDPNLVAIVAQIFAFLTGLLAVIWLHGAPPTNAAIAWSALAGIGSGIGGLMLYRGLAVGRMSTVAPVSAIVAAAIPVLLGIALGQPLSTAAAIGIVLALPAICLVSWQPQTTDRTTSGLAYGIAAGIGFALLFVGLDRAGTSFGAWPLVPEQAAAVLTLIPFTWASIRTASRNRATIPLSAWPGIATGILSAIANLMFLIATGAGPLASVAVISSLYPAITILLARIVLGERWTRTQATGLIASAAAIALIAAG